MDKLRDIIHALCAISGTVMLQIAALLFVNTYVGSQTGHFFDPASSLGGACKILSLFLPFLYTIIAFTIGLVFGKGRLHLLFGCVTGILAVTNTVAPFFVQFIFAGGVNNIFTKFLATVATIISLPVHSMAYAFNDAVNFFFADMDGGRVFVFIATFLSFLLPVILTTGYLLGLFARKREEEKEKSEE